MYIFIEICHIISFISRTYVNIHQLFSTEAHTSLDGGPGITHVDGSTPAPGVLSLVR